MTKTQILGVFVAALAFGMVAVTSASATVWLINNQMLNKEEPATGHGLLLLHHSEGLAGSFLVHCTFLFHGTVGPGALDLNEVVLGLTGTESNTLKCEFTEAGSCGNKAGEEVSVTVKGQPVHTLLELMTNGVTLEHFLAETGKELGYELSCPKIIGFKGSCSGLDAADFLGNGTNGAIFHFLALVSTPCSDGGRLTSLGLYEMLNVTVS